MRRWTPGPRAALVPLALAMAFGCRHAPPARPSTDATRTAGATTADEAEARFLSALSGDVEALAPLLADDFAYLTSEGSILDKQALIEHLRSGATRIDHVASEERRRSQREGLVVTTGHLVVEARRRGEAIRVRSRYVHVWIETSDGWQLLVRESGTAIPTTR
ncbi:MAG: nuclear transport factor 2 family protein [Myxococcota bacterium]